MSEFLVSDCIEEAQCKGNLQFWWPEAHNPSDGNIVFGRFENPDSSVDSCCFYSWTSKIQLRWQKTAEKQLSVLPCTRFPWFVSVPHGASLGSWPSFSPKLWENACPGSQLATRTIAVKSTPPSLPPCLVLHSGQNRNPTAPDIEQFFLFWNVLKIEHLPLPPRCRQRGTITCTWRPVRKSPTSKNPTSTECLPIRHALSTCSFNFHRTYTPGPLLNQEQGQSWVPLLQVYESSAFVNLIKAFVNKPWTS